MRCYIVSSALFVPGRLFTAARLEEERDDLLRKEAAVRAQLATFPARIAEANRLLTEAQIEFRAHLVATKSGDSNATQ
jgi:hypothetical protein